MYSLNDYPMLSPKMYCPACFAPRVRHWRNAHHPGRQVMLKISIFTAGRRILSLLCFGSQPLPGANLFTISSCISTFPVGSRILHEEGCDGYLGLPGACSTCVTQPPAGVSETRATAALDARLLLVYYGRDCHFGCLKEVSKPLQVLFNGIGALMVLTLTILKLRALYRSLFLCCEFRTASFEIQGPKMDVNMRDSGIL